MVCSARAWAATVCVCLCGVCQSHPHLAFVESTLVLHVAVTKKVDALLARFSPISEKNAHTQQKLRSTPLNGGWVV